MKYPKYYSIIKVRKEAKIKKRYNQISLLVISFQQYQHFEATKYCMSCLSKGAFATIVLAMTVCCDLRSILLQPIQCNA